MTKFHNGQIWPPTPNVPYNPPFPERPSLRRRIDNCLRCGMMHTTREEAMECVQANMQSDRR